MVRKNWAGLFKVSHALKILVHPTKIRTKLYKGVAKCCLVPNNNFWQLSMYDTATPLAATSLSRGLVGGTGRDIPRMSRPVPGNCNNRTNRACPLFTSLVAIINNIYDNINRYWTITASVYYTAVFASTGTQGQFESRTCSLALSQTPSNRSHTFCRTKYSYCRATVFVIG